MSGVDRWMPLHVGDYLADTTHLTTQEHGAYLLLIMAYWRNGPLPDCDAHLARTARCQADEWEAIKDTIKAFFKAKGGILRHGRIDAEQRRAREIQKNSVEKGRKGGLAKAEKDKRNQRVASSGHATASDQLDLGHAPIPLPLPVPRESKEERKEEDTHTLVPDAREGGPRAVRAVCEIPPPGFDRFWSAYPRKVGIGAARKAFAAALRKAPANEIVAAVERYRWPSTARFIPHASTWLNRESWSDAFDTIDPTLRALGYGDAESTDAMFETLKRRSLN